MSGQVSVSAAAVRHAASLCDQEEPLSEPRPGPGGGSQDQCSEEEEEVSRPDNQDRVPDHRGGQQRGHHRHGLRPGLLPLQHLPVRGLHLPRSLPALIPRPRVPGLARASPPGDDDNDNDDDDDDEYDDNDDDDDDDDDNDDDDDDRQGRSPSLSMPPASPLARNSRMRSASLAVSSVHKTPPHSPGGTQQS